MRMLLAMFRISNFNKRATDQGVINAFGICFANFNVLKPDEKELIYLPGALLLIKNCGGDTVASKPDAGF